MLAETGMNTPIKPAGDMSKNASMAEIDLEESEDTTNKAKSPQEVSLKGNANFSMEESCSTCKVEFSLFNRRHHCRHCGASTCSAHSSMMKLNLHDHVEGADPSTTKLRRTCDKCKRNLRANIRRFSKINTKPSQQDDGLFAGEDTSSMLLNSKDLEFDLASDMHVQTNMKKQHGADQGGEWSPILSGLFTIPSISPSLLSPNMPNKSKEMNNGNLNSENLLEIM
jgi:hypothetical protein